MDPGRHRYPRRRAFAGSGASFQLRCATLERSSRASRWHRTERTVLSAHLGDHVSEVFQEGVDSITNQVSEENDRVLMLRDLA